MSLFLDHLRHRVLLCDGGMGSLIQAMDLSVDQDFMGRENCTEALSLARPDVIRSIHARYFAAGADCVETNTFGGSVLTLGEFDLADRTRDINRRGVEIAREAAEQFADGRPRFVLGSIGPGTRLPSLGQVSYDTLKDSYLEQAMGLLEGGADAVLIETCQDPLQFKAAINAVKQARSVLGCDTPLMLQITVEATGSLLVGTDISAATTVAHALGVDALGLNCATGPREMSDHVRYLSENWPGLISLQPNAGLPELLDGKAHYPLTPAELADWHRRFVLEDGVNMVGGCCGTTPDHISATDRMLDALAQDQGTTRRPAPVQRTVYAVPSVASLYTGVALRQENAFLSIGERLNANGSKKFRTLQEAQDWDGIVAMAKDQVKEGSNTLDVCTAFVGRDEVRDMTEVVSRLRGAVPTPLVFDSTETPVLEAALKLYGGKAILNSINFEDGEGTAAARLKLAHEFGASVIALTIDENGMAKDADAKVRIARRLYDFAVNVHNLPPDDLMFDPLTFTICTGVDDDRRLGIETLDAIRRIRQDMPRVQIILGLSNISFGLKPTARAVLNSVFLDEAIKAGLTGAIVHISKILPLHTLAPQEVDAALDLIYDRRNKEGVDPLHAFIGLFEGRAEVKAERAKDLPVEDRLKNRIVDGDRQGLEDDLQDALKTRAPLDIINTILLDGMKVVGELFGSGQMQLPFVLQSAETMKAAVALLEPHMEKGETTETRGTLVLATVKGDVHDIGKNLVDIILSNNGYTVVNIGIKQPLPAILQAAQDHKADAIGMSGLLVKSTVIMRENLAEMAREGWDTPVILGGAALTRKFVETDCVRAYGNHGRVAYAKDAFDGLDLMGKVASGDFDGYLAAIQARHAQKDTAFQATAAADITQEDARAQTQLARPVDLEDITVRREDLAREIQVGTPPFWGARVVENISLKTLVPYINERTLFGFQWRYRKGDRPDDDWEAWIDENVRPLYHALLKQTQTEGIIVPKAVYGFWKAASSKTDLILYAEDGETEVGRFPLPRQNKPGGLSITDFVLDDSLGPDRRDVVALQAVTVGPRASQESLRLFGENRYRDYLYLHGLSVEVAEALAEYVHKRIRAELGFASEDARETTDLFRQKYRGGRYSFGYPACPNLEDQTQLLALLGADRISLGLTDEYELDPEQSTSALVLLHPQAKYFSV